MIDKTKLETLSLQALSDLREAVVEVLHSRMRREAHRGFDVMVTDERRGGRWSSQRVRVTGVGPVNLTGYLIDEHGNHLRNRHFRCSPHLAKVVPPLNATPLVRKTPLGAGKDRPVSAIDSGF